MEKTVTYQVETPIKHLGRIVKGGQVTLTEEQAKPWLDSGAIKPLGEAAQANESNDNDETPFSMGAVFGMFEGLPDEDKQDFIERLTTLQPYQVMLLERLDQMDKPNDTGEQTNDLSLVDAIGQLNIDVEDHWTKAGKPEIGMLEALTGRNVSAAERDQAWSDYQANQEKGAE